MALNRRHRSVGLGQIALFVVLSVLISQLGPAAHAAPLSDSHVLDTAQESDTPHRVVAVLTPTRTASTIVYNAVRLLVTFFDPNTVHMFMFKAKVEDAAKELRHWAKQGVSVVFKSHAVALLSSQRPFMSSTGTTHVVTSKRQDISSVVCSRLHMGMLPKSASIDTNIRSTCKDLLNFRRGFETLPTETNIKVIDIDFDQEIKHIPRLLAKLNVGLGLYLVPEALHIIGNMLAELHPVRPYGPPGHHPITFLHSNHVSSEEEKTCCTEDDILADDTCKEVMPLLKKDLTSVDWRGELASYQRNT